MVTSNISIMKIHLAVLLFGISGLFGKLLTLSPILIVLGRSFFSTIFLLFILLYFKENIQLKCKSHYLYFFSMGILLAIHWSSFFKSIQVSTITIGLLTFSTFPIFITFIEPYFFNEKIRLSDIAITSITFLGVVLVIPKFELGNNITQGVLWGIVSGFTYAILSMLNRRYVKDYSGSVIAFYEQFVATIVLIPFLFLSEPIFQTKDVLLLLLLGTVFTGISHSLFINGLKNIKTQTAGIISCLEPLYGIIFATFILNEIPSVKEVLGGIIILGSVFVTTMRTK